jgi:hypothetical protein
MPEFFGRPQSRTMTDDVGIDGGIEQAEHADVNGILDRESQLPVLHAPRWTDASMRDWLVPARPVSAFPFLLVVGYAIVRAST